MCPDPDQSRSGAESRPGTQDDAFTIPLDGFCAATLRARAASLGLAPEDYLRRLCAQAITAAAHHSLDEDWP